MKKPIIIVIEGLDGSGKTTQVEELRKAVTKAYPYLTVATYKFPNYYSSTGKKIKEYLEGRIINPDNNYDYYEYIKDISTLYAYNRFEFFNSPYYAPLLNKIDVIIFDRYNSANLIHMGANILQQKLPMDLIATYKYWDENLEFNILKIPRPDITFFLNVGYENALKNITERNKNINNSSVDIHETSTHLSNIDKVKTYLNEIGFETVDILCTDNSTGNMKSITSITNELFKYSVDKLKEFDLIK